MRRTIPSLSLHFKYGKRITSRILSVLVSIMSPIIKAKTPSLALGPELELLVAELVEAFGGALPGRSELACSKS